MQDGQLKVGDSDREIMARNCPEGSTLTDDCNCISNEGFVEGNECPEGYEKIQHNGGPACQRTTSKVSSSSCCLMFDAEMIAHWLALCTDGYEPRQ